ncbi:hypothetical protein QYF61_004317, partial [Mycteria americana]
MDTIAQAKRLKPLWYGGRWLKYQYGEAWQIDYTTLPQSRQSKRHVLTMVEATTGWLETYPLPHVTAQNTILGLEKQALWCTRSWEGAQPGQLTPTGQRAIPDHMVSCPVYELGEVAGEQLSLLRDGLGIEERWHSVTAKAVSPARRCPWSWGCGRAAGAAPSTVPPAQQPLFRPAAQTPEARWGPAARGRRLLWQHAGVRYRPRSRHREASGDASSRAQCGRLSSADPLARVVSHKFKCNRVSETQPDGSGSAKQPLPSVVIVPAGVAFVPVPVALVPRKQGVLSPGAPWPAPAARSRTGAPHCPGKLPKGKLILARSGLRRSQPEVEKQREPSLMFISFSGHSLERSLFPSSEHSPSQRAQSRGIASLAEDPAAPFLGFDGKTSAAERSGCWIHFL